MEKLKIIYVGTGSFGAPILEKLCSDPRVQIVSVITGQDKKSGRDLKITANPIKQIGNLYKLNVLQPQMIALVNKEIIQDNPDILLVVAYGEIIPIDTITLAKTGAVNIHPSLLPKYRGASPIQSTILNGEKETALSWILMNQKMDQGNIIEQISECISATDTSKSLEVRLQAIAVQNTADVLINYSKNTHSTPQVDSDASYCKKFSKSDGEINFLTESALQINLKIRAFYPWPSCYTFLNGKLIKVLKAQVVEHKISAREATRTPTDTLIIGAKNSAIELIQVQPEGKRPMKIEDYLRGLDKSKKIEITSS